MTSDSRRLSKGAQGSLKRSMSKLIQTPILPVMEEANNNRVVGALICLNELDPEVTDIFKIH